MVFKIGELVSSNAGRDAGKKFIITGIIDKDYVYISDGELRKIKKPKKKKVKHIKTCGIIIDSLNRKLENKEDIIDAEIRKAIASLTKDQEGYKENEEG